MCVSVLMKDMSTDNRNFVLNQLFSALWCVRREVMPASAEETVQSESTQITGHLVAAAKQSAAIGSWPHTGRASLPHKSLDCEAADKVPLSGLLSRLGLCLKSA